MISGLIISSEVKGIYFLSPKAFLSNIKSGLILPTL